MLRQQDSCCFNKIKDRTRTKLYLWSCWNNKFQVDAVVVVVSTKQPTNQPTTIASMDPVVSTRTTQQEWLNKDKTRQLKQNHAHAISFHCWISVEQSNVGSLLSKKMPCCPRRPNTWHGCLPTPPSVSTHLLKLSIQSPRPMIQLLSWTVARQT